ncbi:hypothetical protein HNO92_003688 [Chromobacterium alkanivorans]|uniref:hypothetical protein n=1 Tax=Chromobacterium alkanivorans TaxID=1071719 RepID=UPI002168AE58|nr:hypothetical protein [Chromobacterium alkanivorans]MCS3806401.1 hypothetical protein [Chromobacterium alkanivorans]MCS3820587.1 hypothetical protein [Chromobacterium alkanivorans]MCS3875345.1 hypothetical protein [Chromobacterium alkanivorans]
MAQESLRAALAVSALKPEERAWLESRLSEEERVLLGQALERLDDRPLTEQADELEPPAASPAGVDLLSRGVEPLLEALQAEPVWMQAALGHALGAELRGEVLSAAQDAEAWRGRVDSLRRDWYGGASQTAPALRAAMLSRLQAVTAAVPERPSVRPSGTERAPSSLGARLRTWWGSLRHE